MKFYPAVDIQRGRVARGSGADPADPVVVAQRYRDAGASWIHVVDMDRALHHGSHNTSLVLELCAMEGVEVQVGGNLVSPDVIAECVAAGAHRIVLGTEVLLDRGRFEAVLDALGGVAGAVALEQRDGRLHTRSGLEVPIDVADAAKRMREKGFTLAVHRQIDRDGTMLGLDVEGAAAVQAHELEVIAAGGVRSLDDLKHARQRGLAGVIAGRAILEGRFSVEEALACCG